MQTPLMLSLALGCGLVAAAQPIAFPDDAGRYGYVGADGNGAIPPRYAAAGAFAKTGNDGSSLLAPVRERGYYGYVDTAGAYVIPPRYDYAGPFRDGRAVAYLGRSARVIDATGAEVYVPANDSVDLELAPGGQLVAEYPQLLGWRRTPLRVTDLEGEPLDSLDYGPTDLGEGRLLFRHARRPGGWPRRERRSFPVVTDEGGRRIYAAPDSLDRTLVGNFVGGYAPVTFIREDRSTRLGYLDREGELIPVTEWTKTRYVGRPQKHETEAGRHVLSDEDGGVDILRPRHQPTKLPWARKLVYLAPEGWGMARDHRGMTVGFDRTGARFRIRRARIGCP